MVAADRAVRKRTPHTDITPLSHRRGASALPEGGPRGSVTAH
jgi:hypothetical protein